MKHKPSLMTGAIALALSLLLSFGTVEAMVTGFQLTVEPRWLPAAAGLGAGLLACLLSGRKGGGWVLLALTAAIGIHLWQRTELPTQLWQLVYRITHYYNAAYGWGVFRLVDTPWDAGSAELPLALLGSVISGCTCHSILRGKGAFGPLVLSLLPLVSCLVVTNTVPAVQALFPLLLGQLLLLLSSHVRCRDPHQADRLVLLAAVPCLLFLVLILSCIPKETYVNQSHIIQDQILAWLQDLPWERASQGPSITVATPQREAATLDLAQLGPRQNSSAPVMTVLSDVSGPLYLRGQDHDLYDGKHWTASPYRVEPLGCTGADLGILTVETLQPMAQLYLPYYPSGGLSLIGGRVDNSRLASSYSFRRQGLPAAWHSPAAGDADYSGVDPACLSLPPATLTRAEAYLPAVLQDQETIAQQASAIAAFVRGQSRYDLLTEKMPEDEEDFALWFLETAPSGYCVHYASATVVLLRAAGIPARYVSGYLMEMEAGEPATVTEQQAHAWAEYYEPGLKTWLPAEATPASGIPDPVPPPAALPETATAPAATEAKPPSDQPTAPATQPTVPLFTEEAPPEPVSSRSLPTWPLYLALILLLLLVQPRLRITLRRYVQHKAAPNRRCLLLWKEAERLSRLLKAEPPKSLEELALKAKFSQHTITAQELGQFDRCLREYQTRLKQQPWYKRLLYHLVYAVF